MKGFVIAEEGHIVNILPPIDITGGVACDRFTMEGYAHVTLILQIGVSGAAFTKIFVKECDAFSGGTANAIAYSIYKEETALGDTLGPRVAVTTAGATPSANDGIFYVIELDASELTDGFPFVELSMTNTGNSVIAGAVAILSGSRYGEVESPTVII